jgi:hypothetical protein
MKLIVAMPGHKKLVRPKESIEERIAAIEAALADEDPHPTVQRDVVLLHRKMCGLNKSGRGTARSQEAEQKIQELMKFFK